MPARAALARAGLASRADVPVADLSHGEHRQLEIAMALATKPRMLLLDEPMAGMGPEESARLVKTAARTEEGIHDPADRARHGSRVRARRPDFRSGLWPRDRDRQAGRHPRQPGSRATPISASRKWWRAMADDACSKSTISRPATASARCCSACRCKIAPGEMVTLMGRNGMGKTTTVRSIMGLTPARAGAIRFDGQDIRGLPAYRVAQARRRPRAGRPSDFSQSLHARKPGRDRRQPRRTPPTRGHFESVCALFPRLAAAARAIWAGNCPAASSRCSRSAAR